MVSFNVLEACRVEGVTRYFMSSSSDIPSSPSLFPVEPSEIKAHGHVDTQLLQKLASEELCKNYETDFGIQTRIGRIHNVYGPMCKYRGSEANTPARLCRSVITNTDDVDTWPYLRERESYLYIDDCVEGIFQIMHSEDTAPIELVSDEKVSLLEMKELALEFSRGHVSKEHLVDMCSVRQVDHTAHFVPAVPFAVGLRRTFDWVHSEVQKEQAVLKRVARGSINCTPACELGPWFSDM